VRALTFRILRKLDALRPPAPRRAPPVLESMARGAASAMRGLARSLILESTNPPPWRRALHAATLAPALAVWLAPMFVYARRYGALEMEGESLSGQRTTCRIPDLVPTYVYLFGLWEPDITAFVRRRLEPGDTFVDVGANVGFLTLEAASRVGPRGRVVAFEPAPRLFAALVDAVRRNGWSQIVEARRCAVAAVRGRVALHAGPDHNLALTTTVPRPGLAHEGDVDAVPLDEMVAEEPRPAIRLIKIDVEGAETEVLSGMRRLVEAARQDLEIVVELTPAWWPAGSKSPEEVLRPLLEAGFFAYEIENDYFPWRYLWPNAVGAPKRLRRAIKGSTERIDLVFSRIDADEL